MAHPLPIPREARPQTVSAPEALLPRYAVALPLLSLVPLLVGLTNPIQEIDPAQYAEVGRRIAASGDGVKLFDAWGGFLNKPPMTMWLIALAIRALGATSAAARLPSLLAGAVTVFAVYRIGTMLWDRRTGWTAAALYAASPALLLSVADPKIDALVTAFIALTMMATVQARTSPRALYFAWAFAACGLLTKGPIGVVIPVLGVLPEAIRRRWTPGDGAPDVWWRRILALRPFAGLLLLAAIAGPWFWAMRSQWGNYGPYFILWEQTFGRVLHQSTYNDTTTPLFFVHTGAWAYLPFTPLLLWAFITRARDAFRARALPPDATRVTLWWFLLPFLAISVASAKLPQYAFWLAPPAALMSARFLWTLSPVALRRLQWGYGALAAVSAAAIAFALAVAFPPRSALAGAGWVVLALAAPALLFALTRGRPPAVRTVALAAGVMLGLATFFTGWFHRSLLQFQPSNELGALAKARDPGGSLLPFLDLPVGNSVAFYAERDAATLAPEHLARVVHEGKARVAVVHPDSLGKLAALGLRYELVKTLPTYATSIPRPAFLNASTRPGTVSSVAFVVFLP